MTRTEFTGKRSLDFSGWIRQHLPDSSTGFCVGNTDWIFWNYKTKTLLLAEEKTRYGQVAPWFWRLIKTVFDPALKEYCSKNSINYLGYVTVVFSGTDPTNSKVIIYNDKQVSEEELKVILSFKTYATI